MIRFSVGVTRKGDYTAYQSNAASWAKAHGVRPRGRGVFSAYVRHLLEEARTTEERKANR